MAVTLETSLKRFRGLSSDTKPGIEREAVGQPLQFPPEGSTFTELDTGRRYVYHGRTWILQPQTLEAMLEIMITLQLQVLEVLRATHRGHEEYLWEDEVEYEGPI